MGLKPMSAVLEHALPDAPKPSFQERWGARLEAWKNEPAAIIQTLKDEKAALEAALASEREVAKKRIGELEAKVTDLEAQILLLRPSFAQPASQQQEQPQPAIVEAAPVGPAQALSPGAGPGNPVAARRPAPLSLFPALDNTKPKRKRTPLAAWVEGAAAYLEAVELAAGAPPEAARRVISWGRDQRALKSAFDALGPAELTRRWKILCLDADPFLERNRTFTYFGAHPDKFFAPLRPVGQLDNHFRRVAPSPGAARDLPFKAQAEGSFRKAEELLAEAEALSAQEASDPGITVARNPERT